MLGPSCCQCWNDGMYCAASRCNLARQKRLVPSCRILMQSNSENWTPHNSAGIATSLQLSFAVDMQHISYSLMQTPEMNTDIEVMCSVPNPVVRPGNAIRSRKHGHVQYEVFEGVQGQGLHSKTASSPLMLGRMDYRTSSHPLRRLRVMPEADPRRSREGRGSILGRSSARSPSCHVTAWSPACQGPSDPELSIQRHS